MITDRGCSTKAGTTGTTGTKPFRVTVVTAVTANSEYPPTADIFFFSAGFSRAKSHERVLRLAESEHRLRLAAHRGAFDRSAGRSPDPLQHADGMRRAVRRFAGLCQPAGNYASQGKQIDYRRNNTAISGVSSAEKSATAGDDLTRTRPFKARYGPGVHLSLRAKEKRL